MRGKSNPGSIARSLLAVALGVAVLALPAQASEGGGGKSKRPSIESTSFSVTDHDSTLAEAGVMRASKVTVHVGRGKTGDRFEMVRQERDSGITFWSADIPDRERKCAPVRFVARGNGGTDEEEIRICTFGPSAPEPPELTPDLP